MKIFITTTLIALTHSVCLSQLAELTSNLQNIEKVAIEADYAEIKIIHHDKPVIEVRSIGTINNGEQDEHLQLTKKAKGSLLKISSEIKNYDDIPKLKTVYDKNENIVSQKEVTQWKGWKSYKEMKASRIQIEDQVEVTHIIYVPKNVKIEIDATYGNVEFEGSISSSANLSSTYGHVECKLNEISAPLEAHSTYSCVDIAIPHTAKLDVAMDSQWGAYYTDLDLDYDQAQNDDVMAKLNGGGSNLHLSSPYNNIYLRKVN